MDALTAAGGPPPGQSTNEAAINWLLETDGGANPGAASLRSRAPTAASVLGQLQQQLQLQQRFKMVLVVRMDLGMSPGKIAAQCVHGEREEGEVVVVVVVVTSRWCDGVGERKADRLTRWGLHPP